MPTFLFSNIHRANTQLQMILIKLDLQRYLIKMISQTCTI